MVWATQAMQTVKPTPISFGRSRCKQHYQFHSQDFLDQAILLIDRRKQFFKFLHRKVRISRLPTPSPWGTFYGKDVILADKIISSLRFSTVLLADKP